MRWNLTVVQCIGKHKATPIKHITNVIVILNLVYCFVNYYHFFLKSYKNQINLLHSDDNKVTLSFINLPNIFITQFHFFTTDIRRSISSVTKVDKTQTGFNITLCVPHLYCVISTLYYKNGLYEKPWLSNEYSCSTHNIRTEKGCVHMQLKTKNFLMLKSHRHADRTNYGYIGIVRRISHMIVWVYFESGSNKYWMLYSWLWCIQCNIYSW